LLERRVLQKSDYRRPTESFETLNDFIKEGGWCPIKIEGYTEAKKESSAKGEETGKSDGKTPSKRPWKKARH